MLSFRFKKQTSKKVADITFKTNQGFFRIFTINFSPFQFSIVSKSENTQVRSYQTLMCCLSTLLFGTLIPHLRWEGRCVQAPLPFQVQAPLPFQEEIANNSWKTWIFLMKFWWSKQNFFIVTLATQGLKSEIFTHLHIAVSSCHSSHTSPFYGLTSQHNTKVETLMRILTKQWSWLDTMSTLSGDFSEKHSWLVN